LRRDRVAPITGVSAGVARHLGWRVATTRIAFLALVPFGGAGLLLYAWLWALVPVAEPAGADAASRRSVPVALLGLGLALVCSVTALGTASGPHPNFPALGGVLIAGVGAMTWSLTVDRNDPGRSPLYARVVRIGVAGALLVAGAGTLAATTGRMATVVAVLLVVLGISALVAPFVVRSWTELLAERSTRVRQQQRAEIAAHLHDSVLQTLALIQNRAGASSEIARIARAQERELRDWLFASDDPVAEDLEAEVRDIAASIELEHAVRIEVVSVGDPRPVEAAVVAATREAMLNAARHAGGTVSVYLEATAAAVDVFVRDRGPGVDIDALPSDRLGIRESIVGRMSRAGGSAHVRSGAGGEGTEVHIHLGGAG
jgi:signal transduction histidine kinase